MKNIVLTEKDIDQALKDGVDVTRSIVRHIEDVIIEKALVLTKGNQSAAATLIGMSRTKLGQRARAMTKRKKVAA